KGGDSVRQSVGVQVVVERIVSVRRIEADLDVVILTAVFLKDAAYLLAKVAFDLQNQASDAFLRVGGAVREELFREWVHAAARLAAADRAKDRDAGVKSPVRNRQPSRGLGGLRFLRVMEFANHQKELVSAGRIRIRRQLREPVRLFAPD